MTPDSLEDQACGAENEMKTQKKKHLAMVIIAAAAVIGIVAVLGPLQRAETYSWAVAMVDRGHYPEAKEIFARIRKEDYREKESYIALCDAHIAYDAGDITGAYALLEKTDFEETDYKIYLFTQTVAAKYYDQLYPETVGEEAAEAGPQPDQSAAPQTPARSGRPSTKNEYTYDYDISPYDAPEDFYYNNYDDFLDFEEAEDYYYEHYE